MVEKKIRQVIVPTLAYAGASMLVLWLFVLQETTVPISFLGWQRPVSLTFLGTPLPSKYAVAILYWEPICPFFAASLKYSNAFFRFFLTPSPFL